MSDPVPSTNSPWRSVIIVACVGIIAYSNTFFSPFELDDFSSIVNNGCIQNLGDLHGIWHFLPRRFILYLSLAFNYHFNGLNVCGWHLFNLAVHLAAAVLVWRLALLTFSTPVLREDQIARHAPAIALWAGLIFVSHPVQTEAVTYIVQRAASLAAMFYLASLCLYLKARLLQEQGKPAWKSFYAGCLLSTVAAMYTKETAITLPLMIVLCEVSFLRAWKDIDWKQLIPVLLSLLVIPVTMVLTENSPARIHHLCSEPGISPWQYFLTQLRVIVTYIRLLFLPVHQDFDYDYPVFKSFFQTPVLLSFLFLAAVLLGAKRLWPKYRLVSFGIFFFFLALVPESSILPIKDVIFEHRLYLPMVGFSLSLAGAAYYFLGKNHLKAMTLGLTVIVVCFSALTYARNNVWQDNLTLWQDTVQKSPHKARPYLCRGYAWESKGDFQQAIADYSKVITLDPSEPDDYYNRGTLYCRLGAFAQAISDLDKAIALNPDDADFYNNRAVTYERLKEYRRALADFERARVLGHPVDAARISLLKRKSAEALRQSKKN